MAICCSAKAAKRSGLTQALGRAIETSMRRATQRGIIVMFRAATLALHPCSRLRAVVRRSRQISSGVAGVVSDFVAWFQAVRTQANAATSPAAPRLRASVRFAQLSLFASKSQRVKARAGHGLTIHSSRNCFVTSKAWHKKPATLLPPLRNSA
jgi:hypothetical protein